MLTLRTFSILEIRIDILPMFFYLSVTSVSAQETLTLENCLEMGIENNPSL